MELRVFEKLSVWLVSAELVLLVEQRIHVEMKMQRKDWILVLKRLAGRPVPWPVYQE